MKNQLILSFAIGTLLSSCIKKEEITKVEVVVQQGTYDPATFKANTENERVFMGNYKALLGEINKAKPGTTADSLKGSKSQTITFAKLLEIVNAGTISINSLANDNYKNLVLNSNSGYLASAATASTNSLFVPVYPIPANAIGGRYTQTSGYLFDKYGVDIEELVQKTFFGSIYDKVFGELLTEGNISLANLDKALVYYGAPTSFPNGLKIKVGSDSITDVYIANYAARRDNSNGTGKGGYYSVIKSQFITIQQLLKESPNDKTKINEAVKVMRENWEKALMATAINYLQSSKTGMLRTGDVNISRALHSFCEGLGLIATFKGVKTTRIITDAQIEEMQNTLYFNNMTYTQNPLKYLGNTTEIDKLAGIVAKIQGIYGFSETQVNDYFLKNDITIRNIGMRQE
jgi:hypothetical protein